MAHLASFRLFIPLIAEALGTGEEVAGVSRAPEVYPKLTIAPYYAYDARFGAILGDMKPSARTSKPFWHWKFRVSSEMRSSDRRVNGNIRHIAPISGNRY